MPLTKQQTDNIMKQSVENIRKFIAQGLVKFPDDLLAYSSHPKFKAIADSLANIPDPVAERRWAEIQSARDSVGTTEYVNLLMAFVRQYGEHAGCRKMVDEARSQMTLLTSEVERADWEAVDRRSIDRLLAHRRKYPSTCHETEIDNLVWDLTDKADRSDIRRYMAAFPGGTHTHDCERLLEAVDLWSEISRDPDIVTLSDYIKEVSDSPFIDQATTLLAKLKSDEIDKMIAQPGDYDRNFFRLIRREGIFSDSELIECGVCNEQSLQYFDNPPELPDIEQIGNPNPKVHRGATDVFLFGIPASGKTCVLMGLLGAASFDYDNAAEGVGGEYADNLKIYRSNGKAPGRTYGNFVAQIHGRILPSGSNITYPINLIEMSGEEFAMKIAYNEDNMVDFEDMGTGATRLLTSDNRKVIFIVIDPTANGLIKISTTRSDGTSETKIVQQDIVIAKIINMFRRNPKVLKNVNAIHFIMTKADTLGPRTAREEIAVERIRALYSRAIENLREICGQYDLNRSTGGSPMLFTFSLGRFFVGDAFEYDAADADKIMDSLCTMCQGEKASGFFRKMQNSVNG